MTARVRTSHPVSPAMAPASAVSRRAISPSRRSVPGRGSRCINWREGRIEAGMSKRSPGREAFMNPTWSIGSGGRVEPGSRAAIAPTLARAAWRVGFRASTTSRTCSSERGSDAGKGPPGMGSCPTPRPTGQVSARRTVARKRSISFSVEVAERPVGAGGGTPTGRGKAPARDTR